MVPVITVQQEVWLGQMKAAVDQLHEQWYGHGFGGYAKGFNNANFADVDRKIRTACSRLKIEVVEAFDEDGWDGEQYQPIVTLWDALRAIRKHFGLPLYPGSRF
jgi:hypothetical protein